MSTIRSIQDVLPLVGTFAVRGTVVPMTGGVVDAGTVYVHDQRIADVRSSSAPRPEDIPDNAPVIDTGGVIYPGLIDLHNHLPYNILPLWIAPRRFDHRDEWRNQTPEYRQQISEPMGVLNRKGGAEVRKAIVRYVEVKLLMGGVTSGQGMSKTNANAYKGLTRNFEAPDNPGLLEAQTQIDDLTLPDVEKFRERLETGQMIFYHLAEGIGGHVQKNFLFLQEHDLLRHNVIGIHSLDLIDDDFQAMAHAGARVVWSPLSNSVLYGSTLDPRRLQDADVPFGLGSDWTPSGSRNLLLELKAARLASAPGKGPDARQLAGSVTRQAARVAGWGDALGSLEAGKLADLVVLARRHDDPFENLIRATERDIRLVIIDGEPRYGDEDLFASFGFPTTELETVVVGGKRKTLRLTQDGSILNGLTFSDAQHTLRDALDHLGEIRNRTDPPDDALDAAPEVAPLLDLDMQASDDLEGDSVADLSADAGDAPPLPPLDRLPLDPPTVVDGATDYFDRLESITHLPCPLKGLRAFY